MSREKTQDAPCQFTPLQHGEIVQLGEPVSAILFRNPELIPPTAILGRMAAP